MGYRLEWRLVGCENRLLDTGEIDNGFRDRHAALQALSAFLVQFPVWGRNVEDGGWWAQRSRDATSPCTSRSRPRRTCPAFLAASARDRFSRSVKSFGSAGLTRENALFAGSDGGVGHWARRARAVPRCCASVRGSKPAAREVSAAHSCCREATNHS